MKNLFMFLLMSGAMFAAEKSDKQPTNNVIVTTQVVAQAGAIKKHTRRPHYKVERQTVPEKTNDDQVEAGCCCFFKAKSK